MKPRQSHSRIQAVMTGKQGRIGPQEAHERNVLAIGRAIYRMERQRLTLRRQLASIQQELRAKRRELRQVLQRNSSMSIEEESPALAAAGAADAIDAAEAKRELGERCATCFAAVGHMSSCPDAPENKRGGKR